MISGKLNLINLKFFFILILFLINSSNYCYAKTNKILFKIDNQIITSLDLLQETRYLIALNKELEVAPKDVVYEIAKKSIIRHKIKEKELMKSLESFEIKQEDLNKLILNQFSKININSISELTEFLNNQDLNKNHIEQRIKIQAIWNEFIFAKYSKKIKINKSQIKKELESKKKQNEFLFSEILFNIGTGENFNEKLKIIEEAIINKGFSQAALRFSISSTADNGGKLGWIKETSLNKKIINELNNISISQHTKPIVVPGGFLILKIDNIRKIDVDINSEDVIQEITQKKINEQLNQYSIIYFNKIKKNIIINEY